MKAINHYFFSFYCRVVMLLLSGCTTNLALAQQPALEENWIYLQDGQQLLVHLNFNSSSDILTVSDETGDRVYKPAEVVAFSYAGSDYYSMPFNGGYSFFRVLHEGGNYAVLHKSASRGLLEYFVKSSRGAVQICDYAADTDQYVLCEQAVGPAFGIPAYGESSVQYKVQDAVFLAVGDQVHLVSCKYDTEGQLFASVPSLNKKNRRLLKRLKQVVQNDDKMQQLKKYVATASADLEDPEQLILALKSIYP